MTRTRKAVLIFWCGLISLAYGQKDPAPPETFRLSYADGDWARLSVNQSAVYRRDTKIAATDKAAASEIRQSQNIGFEVELRKLSKNADGSLEVEVTYRRKWRETFQGNEAAAAADYSPLPGKKMTFRLRPDGTAQDIKGYENFPEIIDPASRQPIAKSDFAADIAHLFPRLPDKPVSIGSTWEEAPISAPPNSPRNQEPPQVRHQVLSRVKKNGEDCLRIISSRSSKVSMDRPSPEGGTQQVDMESDRIDVYYFSLKKGMIVYKTISSQSHTKNRRETRIIDEGKMHAMYECAVAFE